jgi:NAD(P)-dependent dehydrogenase (short-subunit alcohol dehydrogenase family)
MSAYLPDVVIDNPWLFGGVAAGAVGLGCVYLIRKWAAGGVCRSQARLDGKTVIITGANSGIGLETAVDLAKRNARVILACRSVERGETAAVEVRKRSGNNNAVFVQLDLASLDSVRKFAAKILEEEPRIDILINNAGVMAIPNRTLTQDGFEMQFGTNHLGHFLLTNLLLDRIKEAPSARIVSVSSKASEQGRLDLSDLNSEKSYSEWYAYGASKLANVLFTRSLAKRLQGTRVTANVLHPGVIVTELTRSMNLFLV